jgi:sugar phosphate isomerase/epimerase
MYVSLNSTLTGGKVPWPDFARLAANIGYGGADLNLNAAMKEGPEATRALIAELKIRLSCCGLPVTATRDDASFQKTMPALEEAAKFVSAIGCPRMTAILPTGSQTPKDELWKTLRDRFAAVAEVLARHNVRLGFEFLGPLQLRTNSPNEFIWNAKEATRFAAECGPNVGLLLDSWHWHHSGGTPEDIIKAGKPRIVTVHVADAAKLPPEEVRDNQRLMPGEGVIDFIGFFRALREIGYEDGISPEPLGRIPKDMPPEEGAKLGLDTTLAVMKKAGVA